ncbi:hypothetical protein KP509_21G083600 [Ceratopteris richardii]|uniref:Nodulin-like domain-containing protein n=1 Tax=Ceratopteris richardii TaxID=49495 RepID=A0A8T2SDJ6_CERRI|nr:hypothetical protein KP509_21G083600 [Ceratopteris richardii]
MQPNAVSLMSRQFAWRLLKGRWMMMVVSLYILAFAGGPYVFGIYSQVIKSELNYDEETIESLSFFKDLGNNVGIVSGLLNEILPAWIVLAVGSCMNMFGFLMIWLAVTHRIAQPPLWQMYLYMTIGSNSMSFFNTGVVVTCVKNFPESRGEVLGLVKGVIGLSTAILTQIYHAVYAQNTKGMILLLGWLPSLVTFVFMFLVRPLKPVEDKREGKYFFHFLYLALLLAAFLTLIIIVENQLHLTPIAYKFIGASILAMVVLNVVVGIRAERNAALADQYGNETKGEVVMKCASKKLGLVHDICATQKGHTVLEGLAVRPDKDDLAASWMVRNEALAVSSEQSSVKGGAKNTDTVNTVGGIAVSGYKALLRKAAWFYQTWPERGDDFSIPHALLSLDMWIIFVVAVCGIGATLTAIDSVGQIGQSLGYSDVSISTCVSLISIWNFLGRAGSGYLSETLLRRYRFPRTLLLMAVIALSCAGHLLIAFPVSGALYIASIIEGLSFGAQWPLLFAIISELFGLKYYATLYNVAPLAAPLGSYLMKVRVAGFLYDREAVSQQRQLPPAAVKHFNYMATVHAANSAGEHELLCLGPSCFRLAFLIMTFITAVGTIIAGWLVLRTHAFYRNPRSAIESAAPDDSEKPSRQEHHS